MPASLARVDLPRYWQVRQGSRLCRDAALWFVPAPLDKPKSPPGTWKISPHEGTGKLRFISSSWFNVPGNDLRLTLPRHLGTRDIGELFRCATQMRRAAGDIELDCTNLEFIDPLGFSVLAAALGGAGRSISMTWLNTDLAKYMERMSFFHHCPVDGYSNAPLAIQDRRDNSVELTCISEEWHVDETAERLATAITGNLTHADPHEPIDMATGRNKFLRFQHPLRYALTELLLNALTHARRDGHRHASVWVAAQVIASTNVVRFSVVDNGCGMLGSLCRHSELESSTHEAAIRLALRPRVSCNRDGQTYTDHGNQGVGLTTTSRIAGVAKGFLTITSGDACISTGSTGDPVELAALPAGASWDGVAVSFECRRGRLPAVRISDLLPPATKEDIPIAFS